MSASAGILVAADATPGLRRERTAVHEAGHAVVAMVLGLGIDHATIKPNRKTRTRMYWRGDVPELREYERPASSGHVRLAHSDRFPRRDAAIVRLAGGEAERLLLGGVPPGGVPENDLRDAMRDLAATTLPRPLRGLGRFGRQIWIHDLHAEAVRLVTEHRDAVRRVADALVERETLSGDDVAAIVWGAA